jgi:hypothetical protein
MVMAGGARLGIWTQKSTKKHQQEKNVECGKCLASAAGGGAGQIRGETRFWLNTGR